MVKSIIYDGTTTEDLERIDLRAGALSLFFEAGTIRYIRVGAVEIIRQIYAAVRNQNWETVPAKLTITDLQVESDSFRLAFDMLHEQGEAAFRWTGTITGGADSTITFEFDGTALRDFQRNRIGFCVLHPMEAVGKPCLIEHVDGSRTEGHFPDEIAAHQPFFDIRAITYEAARGIRVCTVMTGDTFEMEDQRNWTDASFKTYCTPLGLPFPVKVHAGDHIRQGVTVSLVGEAALPDHEGSSDIPTITLTQNTVTIPAVGLGMASHDEPLTASQIARLRELQLAHLRVDLRLYQPEAKHRLAQSVMAAAAVGIPLEIAVFASEDAAAELDALAGWLDEYQPQIAKIAIFHQHEKSTNKLLTNLAQKTLARFGAPIGGGTDAFFAELNRQRPPAEALEFITYSLNPQVHAFDNASLVETLAAQASTVRSTHTLSASKPVHVSPVTFKMRWNPNATAPEPEPLPGKLPPQVDVRQSSLFGAGWTLGSIKHLAESGAAAITYYETTGRLGIMAAEKGSSLPDPFHHTSGIVYPMWHVFRQVGDFAGSGEILVSTSSDPLRVESLVLCAPFGLCVMVSNFTANTQPVYLRNAPKSAATLHVLDEHSVNTALADPHTFLQTGGQPLMRDTDHADRDWIFELPPFGIAFLNWQGKSDS